MHAYVISDKKGGVMETQDCYWLEKQIIKVIMGCNYDFWLIEMVCNLLNSFVNLFYLRYFSLNTLI